MRVGVFDSGIGGEAIATTLRQLLLGAEIPTPTLTPSDSTQPRRPEPLPTTFQPRPSNDPAHDLKRYQEAEHLETASPEDVTPQHLHMVTRDAVVYLHPIAYDTTPTATRHRHPIYAHVPQRRPSSGPVFPAGQLSRHPQMNRMFPSDSDPRPLFNPPLVACREDQSEYIAYHFRPMPAEQSAHYPLNPSFDSSTHTTSFLPKNCTKFSGPPFKPPSVRSLISSR